MNKTKCIIVDDEPTAIEILETYIKQIKNYEIIACCKNAFEAFNIINNQFIDLVFLDINMPEISGISLAKSIPKQTKIIFTTAYREYAVDGFDLQAVDYLLKPIALERLLKSIQKYESESKQFDKKNFTNNTVKKNLLVRSDRKMVKINHEDIMYIESLSDYIKIHTKTQTITTRETITNIELKLPDEEFSRIHRSFIVSVNHISSYNNEYVEIEKQFFPISRTYRDRFLKRFEELL